MRLPTATADNFDEVVGNAGKPVTVLFGTPTCPPCKTMEAQLVKMPHITAYKVDVYEEQELGVAFKINATPTLLKFQGFEVINNHVGAMSRSDLEKFAA